MLQGLLSRGHRSVFVGDMLAGWCPDVSSIPFAMDPRRRREAAVDFTRTAAALAAVPLDPFADNPFIYERRGEGYVLASVGDNGVYDGGDDMSGWIVGGEWQAAKRNVGYRKMDLVVCVPVPQVRAAGGTGATESKE